MSYFIHETQRWWVFEVTFFCVLNMYLSTNSKPYVYHFCHILQTLHLFPALLLFRSLKYRITQFGGWDTHSFYASHEIFIKVLIRPVKKSYGVANSNFPTPSTWYPRDQTVQFLKYKQIPPIWSIIYWALLSITYYEIRNCIIARPSCGRS